MLSSCIILACRRQAMLMAAGMTQINIVALWVPVAVPNFRQVPVPCRQRRASGMVLHPAHRTGCVVACFAQLWTALAWPQAIFGTADSGLLPLHKAGIVNRTITSGGLFSFACNCVQVLVRLLTQFGPRVQQQVVMVCHVVYMTWASVCRVAPRGRAAALRQRLSRRRNGSRTRCRCRAAGACRWSATAPTKLTVWSPSGVVLWNCSTPIFTRAGTKESPSDFPALDKSQ